MTKKLKGWIVLKLPANSRIDLGVRQATGSIVRYVIIAIGFERPIKIGDRIEVGQVTGDVVDISARATTVITNDNIAIIIPNSEFIGSKVTNWSYTTRDVRVNFPVRVSYREDPEAVRKLLLEVAESHPGVLKERRSDVLFQEFGDSSLQFILRVWTRDYTDRPGVLRSELNYAISRKFREHRIEIPYPQRDIHIKDGSLTVVASTPSTAP